MIHIDNIKCRHSYLGGTKGVIEMRNGSQGSDGHTFTHLDDDTLWISGFVNDIPYDEDRGDDIRAGFYFTLNSGKNTISFWTCSDLYSSFFESGFGYYETGIEDIDNSFEVDIFVLNENTTYEDYDFDEYNTPTSFGIEYSNLKRYKFRYNIYTDSWTPAAILNNYSVIPLYGNVKIIINNCQYLGKDNGYIWEFSLSDGKFAMSAWDTPSGIDYDVGGIYCLSMYQYCETRVKYVDGDRCKFTIWLVDEADYYEAFREVPNNSGAQARDNKRAQDLAQLMSDIINYLENEMGLTLKTYTFEYNGTRWIKCQ